MAILPEGFSWATSAAGWTQPLPTCVTHWSSWISITPYGRLNPSTGAASCSYTCTPDGVQQLVSVTGKGKAVRQQEQALAWLCAVSFC